METTLTNTRSEEIVAMLEKQGKIINLEIKHYCGHTTIAKNKTHAVELFSKKYCSFCNRLKTTRKTELEIVIREWLISTGVDLSRCDQNDDAYHISCVASNGRDARLGFDWNLKGQKAHELQISLRPQKWAEAIIRLEKEIGETLSYEVKWRFFDKTLKISA